MKETFYFSHDYNTREDEKIKELIYEHGMLGYGIYWAIIEMLYQNANALRLNYKRIAFELRSEEKIIESIINDFQLFEKNDEIFYSISVKRRLEERDLKSKKARESAKLRWNGKNEDANALRNECDRIAIKESKVKENKGKDILLEKEPKTETTRNPFNEIFGDIANEEEKEKKVALKKEKEPEPEMPEDFKPLWTEWKQYRKDRKKKPYAALKWEQIAVNKLLTLSNRDPELAQKILNQTYENNYEGFFPLKQENYARSINQKTINGTGQHRNGNGKVSGTAEILSGIRYTEFT